MSTISMSIVSGKFLGSLDNCIVGGNAPYGRIQLYSIHNDVFTSNCAVYFEKQQLSTFELCGIPRIGKTVVAAACTSSAGASNICLSLLAHENLQRISSKPMTRDFAVSTLSFYSPKEELAAGDESGNISIWNIEQGTACKSFIADSTGINSVLYQTNGQLLSLGNSLQCKLKLWDLRYKLAAKFDDEGNNHEKDEFLSICNLSDYHIACGTSSGQIVIFDIRSNLPVMRKHVHSGPVTSLSLHPLSSNCVLSGSSDGSMMLTDLSSDQGELGESREVLRETLGGIADIDCIQGHDTSASAALLVTSTMGGLCRLML